MSANTMILHKAWLDTRWRFSVGLAVLACSVAGTVLLYPEVQKMLPMAAGIKISGAVGDEIRKAIQLSSTFSGYAWLKWYDGNLLTFGTLLAALLGAGGMFSGGAALYTLALPVSRRNMLFSRAGLGLAELFVALLVPSLAIPILAPAVGESASYVDALIHAACAIIAASLFFSLTLYLTTVFSDVWRPLLLTLVVAGLDGLAEAFYRDQLTLGPIHTMSGFSYHTAGDVPWIGLAICATGAAALIWAAALNLERRDF